MEKKTSSTYVVLQYKNETWISDWTLSNQTHEMKSGVVPMPDHAWGIGRPGFTNNTQKQDGVCILNWTWSA